MTSFNNPEITERLPNIMYFDNYSPYYMQQQEILSYSSSPFSAYNYGNHVTVSPPMTPSVSPLPSKIHNVQKWDPSGSNNSNSSTNNSSQPPSQRHKHVCQFQFCGWSFKRYEHLKRHMLVHTGERPHTCDYPGCGKSFSRSDNFHAHYRTHTKKKQPKKRAVIKHRVTNKTNESQHSMASTVAANAAAMVAVSQQFGQNGDRQVYYNTNMYEMNTTFTDYAPFMGLSSSPMSPISPPTPTLSLLNHENYGSNSDDDSKQPSKSHICPVIQCSRRFKRLEHLKRHMRIHTLEKPFCCTYPGCQKSFSRSDNLAQHAKTHLKHQDKRKRKQQ